jgi:hypothetical protein
MEHKPQTWQKTKNRRYYLVQDLVSAINRDRRLATELCSFPRAQLSGVWSEVVSRISYNLTQTERSSLDEG